MNTLTTPSDATEATVRQADPVSHQRSDPNSVNPAATATPLPASQIDLQLAYELQGPTDFLFQIHAYDGMDQRVISESLELDPPVEPHLFEDPIVNNRLARMRLPEGPFKLRYRAEVRRSPVKPDLKAPEVPVCELPDELMHALVPTRYCESDKLARAACKMFGDIEPGYARVQAISDWVHDNVDYEIGSSDSTTTASDVFMSRAGVCRNFAHLAITFCRALCIPARLVVGYAKFEEPPNDFHAVFEAYLGHRWVLFDPTKMSPVDQLIRIAMGSDAKDVAFATFFGKARMLSMDPAIVPAPVTYTAA